MQNVLTTLEQKVAPGAAALLIVDMQNDFCAPGGYIHRVKGGDVGHTAALADRIGTLLAAAREGGVKIVWVRAIYDPHYLPAPMLAKQQQLGLAGETLCLEGSWGAEFFAVSPAPGEFVIDKHRYSAFSGTGLDNLLREHGVRSLIIAGVATNVCVESTLRDGFMHGYYIVIPQDCVGSHNQELHRATLENVRLTFGDVTDGAAIMAAWDACARAATPGTR